MLELFAIPLVKTAVLIGALMTAAAYLVLLERWMAAWVQDRKGPNRVGIPLTKVRMFGLGQPLADGLKFLFKEEFTPKHVEPLLYTLAPVVTLASALAIYAVIPMGDTLPIPVDVQQGALKLGAALHLVVTPGCDVGLLYIFALSSMAVYGVILGGWASNDKYSFLGGLRTSAQMVAYELPLGVGILGVVVVSGSLDLGKVIQHQADTGLWNALAQPLGLTVFVVAAFAEAARLPFDLPECEQELVGGYHTEYSGMRLITFLIAEFMHMVTVAFLIVILFFGGWHFWGLTGAGPVASWTQGVLRIAILQGKVLAVILFFMLVRWSWPRFRFDQLMALAWKVMLPQGLVNLALVAILCEPFIAEKIGSSHWAVFMAVSWIVALLTWIVTALVQPSSPENRPASVEPSV